VPNRTDPASEQQTLTLQQAMELAVQHLIAGDLSTVENIYQQILQTAPNHPDALHLLGVIAHQKGENQSAVDLITKALAIKPDYAEAHSNLGIVFRELGQLDEALSSYYIALTIKPDYADANYNLGNTFTELGRMEEAVTSYNKALAIKPDYVAAQNNLGNVLVELGQLEMAVVHYQKAISIKPDYADTHNNLGNALRKLGRIEEAVASYNEALLIKPDYIDAHSNLGVAFKNLDQLEKSLASYRKALKLSPCDEVYFPSFAFLGDPVRHFWLMGTIALLENLDRPITMLEVGTWLGSSLLTWDQSITAFHSKGGKILCVDAWKPYLKVKDDADTFLNAISDSNIAFGIFCHNKNTVTCKVDHYRGVSKEILPGLESGSFDIVYIDGSHYYDDVVKDIEDGCRLVRDGGYICGDDLEIQWNDAHQEHAHKHKDEDYVQDPEGRHYHPGVTVAVYDVLGEVTCHEGYWIMQKQDGKLNQVRFKEFHSFIPSHFPTEWKNKLKDYVGTLAFEGGSQKAS